MVASLAFFFVAISVFALKRGSSESLISPFKIEVNETQLQLLHQRVEGASWPTEWDSLSSSDWSHGIPHAVLRELVNHLLDKYDYHAEVSKLNEFSQYITDIEGYKVHFIHQLSPHEDAKPLMFVHGWPGSFIECTKLIPYLTRPELYGGNARNSFHVVCPSIPGYGFSRSLRNSSFDQYRCAEIFYMLMARLGYNQYFLQGGDWGSVITTFMSTLPQSSDRILGLHLNMVPSVPPIKKGLYANIKLLMSALFPWGFYTADERKGLLGLPKKTLYETGYFHEQATRPQTLSYGLTDSPIGLLAWISEKYYQWGDCNGDLFSQFSKDELLTNFMIYWTTNTAASSIRFYYEFINGGAENRPSSIERLFSVDVQVPTAFALFPVEIFVPVRFYADFYYSNIVHWHHMPQGGHFAAFEEPELMARDLWAFRQHIRGRNSTDHDCDL